MFDVTQLNNVSQPEDLFVEWNGVRVWRFTRQSSTPRESVGLVPLAEPRRGNPLDMYVCVAIG